MYEEIKLHPDFRRLQCGPWCRGREVARVQWRGSLKTVVRGAQAGVLVGLSSREVGDPASPQSPTPEHLKEWFGHRKDPEG